MNSNLTNSHPKNSKRLVIFLACLFVFTVGARFLWDKQQAQKRVANQAIAQQNIAKFFKLVADKNYIAKVTLDSESLNHIRVDMKKNWDGLDLNTKSLKTEKIFQTWQFTVLPNKVGSGQIGTAFKNANGENIRGIFSGI